MKLLLIQTWFGPIPDYFWFHYETTKNLNIDFLFVTDQDLDLDSPNYRIIKKSKDEIEQRLSQIFNTDFRIKNNKKTCDLKASFGHLYEEYTEGYDYIGVYDIDTLFGDAEKYLSILLGNYDFISIGDENIHNRLSGPFLIFKNLKNFRELYINEDFVKCFESEEVQCYEESVIDRIVKEKYSFYLIDSSNSNTQNGGKNEYSSFWSGEKVFVKGEEKLLYHFYRKDHTKFQRIGNTISAYYDKKYHEDFLWVVHFSEKYETLLPYLMDSLKKFSNRKCVFYSINYSPSFMYKTQFESDQFIFRRIDMEPGPLDSRGRDSRIMNSKPLILMDAIKSFPGKKFVHIDTDIYLTTNSDDISKYFDRLENYPLINSHVHDVMYISGINPNEEWTSPLHVLLNAMGEEKEAIFPRRKCNVIVFDERSYWFFEEQMALYNQFKDSGIPGILSIFDEDTANSLLAKYQLKNCLPLVDIEESYNLNVEKIYNYSYNMTGTSPWAELPKSVNDILFFHGFKDPSDYVEIQNQYGTSTLENEEMILKYSDGMISFEKNSFMSTKKIDSPVDFIVYDSRGLEILRLSHQDFHRYWLFYIDKINLDRGKYLIKILENSSQKCIFNDLLEVK
jgi:hypothetical protein